MKTTDYYPPKTVSSFMKSEAFYRGIMGAVGSGKSSGCCMEIMKRATQQKKERDGIRRTRFCIIRNCYPELRDTTIKTWLDWFPEDSFGNFNQQYKEHYLKFGDVESTIMFRALDRPKDIKKVLSMEITGAWINEAREIGKGIVDAVGDRVGRYPAEKEGGCTWRGIIMDTNPPDDDHWWYKLAEEKKPKGWEFFKQPPGMIEKDGEFMPNEKAENIQNLEKNYYERRVPGKSPDYIRVYYCGRYGFVKDGKPVFSEYYDNVHCSKEILEPVKDFPIYVGIDFGLTPAATFWQYIHGVWIGIDELVTDDMGTTRFSELLNQKIATDFDGFDFKIYGDPAGDQRAQTDEKTPFQILRANGIEAKPTYTNDFIIRRESMAVPMLRMVEGKPSFVISPKCKLLRKGLAGGYCYKRVQVSGAERYKDKPDKNRYSHVVDSAMYALVGGGEGKRIIKNKNDIEPKAQNFYNDLADEIII